MSSRYPETHAHAAPAGACAFRLAIEMHADDAPCHADERDLASDAEDGFIQYFGMDTVDENDPAEDLDLNVAQREIIEKNREEAIRRRDWKRKASAPRSSEAQDACQSTAALDPSQRERIQQNREEAKRRRMQKAIAISGARPNGWHAKLHQEVCPPGGDDLMHINR